MKTFKLFQVIVLASLFASQVNAQELPLAETPWSTNCADASGHATVYEKDGYLLTRQFFHNGTAQEKPTVFTGVTPLGNDLWRLTSGSSATQLTIILLYKNNAYRIIEMLRGTTHVVKNGVNISTQYATQELKACSLGTPVYARFFGTQGSGSAQVSRSYISESKSYIFENLINKAFGNERGIALTKKLATDICFIKEVSEKFERGEAIGEILTLTPSWKFNQPGYWLEFQKNAKASYQQLKNAMANIAKVVDWTEEDLVRELLGTQKSSDAYDCHSSNAAGELGMNLAIPLFTNLNDAGHREYLNHFGMPEIGRSIGVNIFLEYYPWRINNLNNFFLSNLKVSKAEFEKKAADEENLRKWHASPEGKKYLAEEAAKRRKAELEEEAKEKEKRAQAERYQRQREAQDKLTAENCKKATGMSVGASEQLATALKVSVSTIRLLRTQSYGSWCEAVVDTPKGIHRCKSEVRVKDNNIWVHFTPMMHCN